MKLKGKTVFITGASRGIGREIALKASQEGANVAIAAKTAEAHPTLPGTIYTVAKEIEESGGNALPLRVDVRHEEEVQDAIEKCCQHFGGVDILINNAGAIYPFSTLQTPMKRFDLMFSCNVRAAFLCSQAALPYLMKSTNAHILNLSPPLDMQATWFKDHLAYTMSKYGMSMCTLGMAEEFREAKVAVNSLWPVTLIATSAISTFFPQLIPNSRKPSIVADAAIAIIEKDSAEVTGNFFLDEEVLRQEGISDFSAYAIDHGMPLQKDLFIPH